MSRRSRKNTIEMAKFDKLAVMGKMAQTRIVPVFYNSDAEIAKKVVKRDNINGVLKTASLFGYTLVR